MFLARWLRWKLASCAAASKLKSDSDVINPLKTCGD